MRSGPVFGLLASAALVVALVPAARAGSAAELEIPIRGQVLTQGTAVDGSPAVVTVHRVARTDDATIVYWSLGVPEGQAETSRFLGLATTSFDGRLAGPQQGDVGLIDPVGLRVFRPLTRDSAVDRCACSTAQAVNGLEPGQASVLWVALAPLPAEVDTVDVAIAEQVIPDVPVEEGLLEPLAENQRDPVILGMGWPEVDQALIDGAQTPAPYAITARVSNLEQSVTTSKGEVALAADVLFAKDSARLTAKGRATVAEAATKIKAAGPGTSLTVTGHTDSDASDRYNLTLSRQRADAVAAFLRPRLGAGYSFRTAGKGESQPVADNKTEAGKAKNRRVSITFGAGS